MAGENFKVGAPGGFVPEQALSFAAADGTAISVTDQAPLPVEQRLPAARAQPLAGGTSATGVIGPFTPDLGRPVWVQLSGTWAGRVRLLRSSDGGTTRLPISYPDGSAKANWTGNVHAIATEESVAGATYYLDVTLTSGTLTYRMEQ